MATARFGISYFLGKEDSINDGSGNGADVNVVDEYGNTALIEATQGKGHTEIVKILKTAGAR